LCLGGIDTQEIDLRVDFMVFKDFLQLKKTYQKHIGIIHDLNMLGGLIAFIWSAAEQLH